MAIITFTPFEIENEDFELMLESPDIMKAFYIMKNVLEIEMEEELKKFVKQVKNKSQEGIGKEV